jgi:4-amino-4-deoxy-L-arabinose transferase-like glycosyltransferase
VLLVFYAALLRFDALVSRYGFIEGPPRVVAVERHVVALARRLAPPGLGWTSVDRRGDPVSYLKIARQRRSFYEAGREPLAIGSIQPFLWLTGDQDIAVNCASATFSTLAVLGVYLVGTAGFSSVVGLAAGGLLAVEAWVITYGVDGWRDDAFTFFTLMAAYGLLRLRLAPTLANALLSGGFAAAACLTRLTSFTFVVPSLIWVVLDGPREDRRQRIRSAAVAFGIVAALSVPFLVSNTITYGDPFHSFNFATELYRGRAGLPVETPMAWAGPFVQRIATRPLALADSLMHGFTTYPMERKWLGYSYLSPILPEMLEDAAIVGLVLLAVSANGRLCLVVLFAALVPFAVVWEAPAARQLRLTSFAYPFYLIAAVEALRTAISVGSRRVRREWMASLRLHRARWALTAMVLLIAIWPLPPLWQYLLVREAALGEGAYSIVAGGGDGWFFGDGWYAPVQTGNVPGRYSRGPAATLFMPVFDPQPLLLTFRLQACSAEPEPVRSVRVAVNGTEVGQLRVVWNAHRAGSYDVAVPLSSIRPGWNEIDLVADGSTLMSQGESRFVGLEPGSDTGFLFWYLRVTGTR